MKLEPSYFAMRHSYREISGKIQQTILEIHYCNHYKVLISNRCRVIFAKFYPLALKNMPFQLDIKNVISVFMRLKVGRTCTHLSLNLEAFYHFILKHSWYHRCIITSIRHKSFTKSVFFWTFIACVTRKSDTSRNLLQFLSYTTQYNFSCMQQIKTFALRALLCHYRTVSIWPLPSHKCRAFHALSAYIDLRCDAFSTCHPLAISNLVRGFLSFITSEVLLCGLLESREVFTRLFLNWRFAMCSSTLKYDALEYQ